MADNYRFTAERTQRSSKALHDSENYFDACYLAGYVVECYMKVLYKHVTKNDPALVHDLSKLKSQLKGIKKVSTATALQKKGFWLDVEQYCQRICKDWDPKYRYDDAHPWDEGTSTAFQNEIKRCLAQIARLKTNGLID